MGILDELNLDRQIKSKAEYKERLQLLQLELLQLQTCLIPSRKNLILIFEGPDAAGKGGSIKRLTERLDPRLIKVYSIGKPTHEEYQHHYMWRFWQKLPKHGEMVIFDRSWYGRVLVERVEGFATKEEWLRAYDEINQFEKLLCDGGSIICKFYIQVSKDEQLKRFKIRETEPYKRWKMNDEDWRNREKWDEHNEAAEAMLKKTDKNYAPWYVIEGNCKNHARIKIIQHVIKRLKREVGE